MLATEYRNTPVPEHRVWVYVVLRADVFVSVHTHLAHAARDAQAVQGARHLEWTAVGRTGAEVWTDQRQVWLIRRTLLDP